MDAVVDEMKILQSARFLFFPALTNKWKNKKK